MINPITTLAVLGVLLCAYAIYVEIKSRNKNYRPACDINSKISCTKAFKSGHGKTFGVSNPVWGMFFYLAVLALSLLGFSSYIFYLSIFSFVGTLYLAYLLYFDLKNLCLVCTGIYLVNVLILVFSYLSI